MLFKQAELDRIARGEVTLAFRRPTVKAGGKLRTPVGVLAIEAVDRVALERITAADVRHAGFADLAALRAAFVPGPDGDIYRIKFRLVGDDLRIALRERASSPMPSARRC